MKKEGNVNMMKPRKRNFDFIKNIGFDYTEDVSAIRNYFARNPQDPIGAVCEVLYYNVDNEIKSARFVWICDSIADLDVFVMRCNNLRDFIKILTCSDAVLDQQAYFVYDGVAYKTLVKSAISVPSVFKEIDKEHITNLKEYLLP